MGLSKRKMKCKSSVLIFIFFISCRFLGATESPNLTYISASFWHDVLAQEISVNKSMFKLYPGTVATGTNSVWLWNIFNAVVSTNDLIYYNPVQLNSFYSDYGLLLYKAKSSAFVDKVCPLNDAIVKYSSTENKYAWDKTIENLNNELLNSQKERIERDTIVIISGDTTIVKVEAAFDNFLVFYSYPYAVRDSLNPILKNYNPWFTNCIFKKMYYNADQQMLNQVDWEAAFGKNGYLQQICVALLVAKNGYYTISTNLNGIISTDSTKFTSPILLGVVIYPTDNFVTALP